MSGMATASNVQAAQLRQQWLDDACQAASGERYLIKRQDLRYPWYVPLEVRVATPDGHVQTYVAMARNISAAGLQFHCRHNIGVYARVEVLTPGRSAGVPVVVRHQTPTVSGFLIGAEFCD